jgi:hypothetical protein
MSGGGLRTTIHSMTEVASDRAYLAHRNVNIVDKYHISRAKELKDRAGEIRLVLSP